LVSLTFFGGKQPKPETEMMALLATCSGRRQNSSAASPFPNQNRKRKWCRPNRQQHVTGKRIDGSFPPYFPANNKYHPVTNKWQGIGLIFLTANRDKCLLSINF